jgi:hypothetical protein
MPHKVDVYRVHVQTFDAQDKRRIYIIEPSEMSGIGNINLPIADLTSNLERYLDRVVVPLLLVTFSSTNQTDAEDLKWDAVQLGYKLGYNPLRTGDATMLRLYFRMWVLVATYDLILPFTNCSSQLEETILGMIRHYAVKILGEIKRLTRKGSEEGRLAIHLSLYIIALCCFAGGSAPSDIPVRFAHIRVIRELFEEFRKAALGLDCSAENIIAICRIRPDFPLVDTVDEESVVSDVDRMDPMRLLAES